MPSSSSPSVVHTMYITEKGCNLLAYPDVAAIYSNLRQGGTWYDTVTRIIPRMKMPEIRIFSTSEAELKALREDREQRQRAEKLQKIHKYGDALYADVAAMPHESRTMLALTEFIADSIAAVVPADLQDDIAVYVSDRTEAAGLVYTPPAPATPPRAKAHLNYRQRLLRGAMESFRPELYSDICIEAVHMPEICLSPQAPRRARAWTETMKFM